MKHQYLPRLAMWIFRWMLGIWLEWARARAASKSAELHELLPSYHVSTSAFLQQPISVLMWCVVSMLSHHSRRVGCCGLHTYTSAVSWRWECRIVLESEGILLTKCAGSRVSRSSIHSEWVSEQFLNGTSAHITLFSTIHSFSAIHGMVDLHKSRIHKCGCKIAWICPWCKDIQ